jgi:hypothetical protein
MPALTLKLDTLYAACSPGVGVVCYGQCEDEALNNLMDEIRGSQNASVRSSFDAIS